MSFYHCLTVGLLLLTCARYSSQAASGNSTSYVAAVVEFRPATDGNGTAEDLPELVRINIHNANQIIQNASQYGADIIVFPEFGSTSLANNASSILRNATEYRRYYRDVASRIPSPEDKIVLCDTNSSYAKSLQSISCLAQQYKIYVVTNHHERVDCPSSNCSSDGFLLYNTNVVFDRKGTLIARYRKYNLLQEPGTNVTREPEISTFTTDFGVTFGQIVGLDLLMEQPSRHFVRNPNITDVVFSSRLFKQLPFSSSLEDQAAYAYVADVNLLAAGYNTNVNASGGSGIYAGKSGPIVTYRTGQLGTALLIANVPILDRRERVREPDNASIVVINGDEMLQLFDDTADRGDVVNPVLDAAFVNGWRLKPTAYKYWPLGLKETARTKTLCVGNFCCLAEVNMTPNNGVVLERNSTYYRYMLWSVNARNYELTDGRRITLEFCGLVACTSELPTSCGQRYSNDTELVTVTNFDSVKLTGFGTSGRGRRAPVASNANGLLRGYKDFSYVDIGPVNSTQSVMFTEHPIDDIMLFGIVGRNFEKDLSNAATSNVVLSLLSLGSVVLMSLYASLML